MLNSLPFSLLVGVILGYLSGLGVGGGSLLIVYLTAIIGMDAANARIINLMFFIAAAVSVSLVRYFRGALKIKPILPSVVAGCCCAAVSAYGGQFLQQDLLKKLYGILLVFIGIRELLYRPRNAK